MRSIVLSALKKYRVKVYLFGSYAKGTAALYSDMDIAADPEEPLPPAMLSLLKEKLEESPIPYRVDLVDLSQADPNFRQAVIQQGVLWNG